MEKHVVVLGAGIMGMAVAYRLLSLPNQPFKVTVVSEFFSPGTLSDRSVGIWGPYLPGCPKEGPDFEKVLKWGKETKTILWQLMRESSTNEWGVYDAQLWMLSKENDFPVKDCPYHSICDYIASVKKSEENILPEGFNSALRYSAPQIIPVRYLSHLTNKVKKLGGIFVRKTIENIKNFEENYPEKIDIIVNCLGLGAKPVVDDPELQPIRGVLVKLPPIPKYMLMGYECLLEGQETYAVFRPDCTLLGGTAIIGDWTKQNKEEEVQAVLQRNIKMIPDLAKYEYISDWSGLRPGRKMIRLEMDTSLSSSPVIHNYGHGGAGWSLHWGCATDVIQLIQQHFERSKL